MATPLVDEHLARRAGRIGGVGRPVAPAIVSGGSTGWHSHPGPAVVIVKSGSLTLYDAGASVTC
jgi:hypothetical protein